MRLYRKPVADSANIKGRVLYLMGATWHNKCMFDLESDQDSFATILQQAGIETYTFDNLPDGHEANVNFAVELVNRSKIDYILGYSYGCITACDVAKRTTVKGVMLLDPISLVKVNKYRDGNNFIIIKNDVELALVENKVKITDNVSSAYLQALSSGDTLTVPTYPGETYKKCDYFKSELFNKFNVQMFLTSQSVEESRSWCPESTVYYPESSHWILLESGRKDLADDIVKFINQ
jgi:hypothetical protein